MDLYRSEDVYVASSILFGFSKEIPMVFVKYTEGLET